MRKVQGEFASRAEAERAVDALRAAGVPEDRVRIWNIIPEGVPAQQPSGGVLGGALTGAILGGTGGLLAGATAGKAVDIANEKGSLPGPRGARVVVDALPAGPDAAEVLREHGATNIK